jgi:transcriptional regulator with XRE-family HTH domain
MTPHINQSIIAEHANVTQPDIANYLAGRLNYVTEEKQQRIRQALKLTKAELVRRHLLSGKTITPLESLKLYGLHALSQQVTKWRARRIDVRNIVPGSEKYQTYAVYALFINGEQATGDQK